MITLMAQKREAVSLTNPPAWLKAALAGGSESWSGETVTVEGALAVTAVLAGFTILTEDIASLPLKLYRRLKPRGREAAYDRIEYSLLHDSPNEEMTALVYRRLLVGHLLGWGNAYSQIITDARGIVRELWPLRPDRMEVFRDKNGERKYLYTLPDNTKRAFRWWEIWHIPAFDFDGVKGYSRIALARNAIGLSMSAERYGSRVFKHDARPSVAIKHPGNLRDKGVVDRLREDWMEVYGGANNAGKPLILEEGMDLKEIGFPPQDAQFLQTRQFQVDEIARMFRIPPHMLGNVTSSTSWGSGIEQQEQGYLNHTLRPWLVMIEQQANKDLLLADARRTYYFEHVADAILRTDISARMSAYATAITNGIMTRNEVRERESLNPIDGADDLLVPLNMGTVGDQKTEPVPHADPASTDDAAPRWKPLLDDALRRMLKREQQDLLSAAHRWLAYENKRSKFGPWLEQFYKQDHPNYMRAVLRPFISAQMLSEARVSAYIADYCTSQGTSVEGILRASPAADLFDDLDLIADAQTQADRLLHEVTYDNE